LLKTLEEPPPHIIFMMATTQPEDIPQTIRSRCQNFSFHAVKFDEIVAQLAAIARKENIRADDAALALLAEAGDGSMRDALSIFDQVIAGSEGRVNAEQVRALVGNVSSEALEELMGAVDRSSSEEALRLLDRLMVQGHNPAHFARQMVRLLRNTIVAKVGGVDSPLLQISADERARAARLAERFSEEDLARFLQIMLRTFDDIGYRQEQRFHLELGVLKMVHAQRILPLEEVLSQVASEGGGKASAGSRPTTSMHNAPPASAPERKAEPAVSPLAADRARKSRSEPEMANAAVVQSQTATAAATAIVEVELTNDAGTLLGHVVSRLEEAGHKMVAHLLESGSAVFESDELKITVQQPPSVIELMMGQEQKRVANAAASTESGRTVKVIVVGGATAPNGATAARPSGNGNTATARGRAAEDPVVRRMQEKFRAEIRTVIDHRDKN
jgi:DNA polymerase-3 subunit gamma/tau